MLDDKFMNGTLVLPFSCKVPFTKLGGMLERTRLPIKRHWRVSGNSLGLDMLTAKLSCNYACRISP